jgi:predicted phosphate transport protein (TIGR00153 family)
MLIFKKEKETRKLVLSHVATTQECIMEARSVLEDYIAGDVEAAIARAKRVIEIESEADQLKRQTRELLYSGAFLPQIRSDIYRLIEAVDSVAGQAESVSNLLAQQKPEIPEEFESEFLEIFSLCVTCFNELRKALKDYFKPKGMLEELNQHVARVSELETAVDVREAEMTRRIFETSMEHSKKLHLRELLRKIADIADKAEDASDELEFAALKSVV